MEKDIEAIEASYSPYVALAGTATADVTNSAMVLALWSDDVRLVSSINEVVKKST